MNKKVLLIPVAIGFLIFIVAELLKKDETGNNFEMTVPENAKDSPVDMGLKGLTMYLDNSGSMKGYLDFSSMLNGNKANATFISTLSNFMDNVKSSYHIEPVCLCGGFSYNRSSFLQGMEDFYIFKGAITELHKSIGDLVSVTTDSTVSVFASDMVLSYGKKTLLNKGKFFNKQQLEQLGAYVHDAMTDAKDKGYHALLLQYYSDFNGRYYYNNTENIMPNAYNDTLMEARPYYILAIGKEKFLKNLMSKRAFSKPVYATFDIPAPQKKISFEIVQNDNNVAWIIGNPDPKFSEEPGTIMTNADFGNAISTLEISFPRFDIPGYINLQEDGKLKPIWDKSIIDNVVVISDPVSDKQSLKVILKPHNELQTVNDVQIQLCSDNDWIDASTAQDDTGGSNISKKTWGFSTIVTNINKVFRSDKKLSPEIIAELKFNMIIK